MRLHLLPSTSLFPDQSCSCEYRDVTPWPWGQKTTMLWKSSTLLRNCFQNPQSWWFFQKLFLVRIISLYWLHERNKWVNIHTTICWAPSGLCPSVSAHTFIQLLTLTFRSFLFSGGALNHPAWPQEKHRCESNTWKTDRCVLGSWMCYISTLNSAFNLSQDLRWFCLFFHTFAWNYLIYTSQQQNV